MADIRRLRQNRKCKNYISAFVATYKTGEALENFTEQGLLSVHNHIKQKLGNMPVCVHQCSRVNGDIKKWCGTCTSWRVELENFMRPGVRRNWNYKKSWCWPNSAAEIAEVFILPGWNTNNINLKDLSTIFNVCNRCLKFPRPAVQVLEKLKESRNDLVHNTANMKLTNAKKKAVFQNITNVVNHPDIKPFIPNSANLLQTLVDLKKDKLFQDDIMLSLKEIGMQNADIKARLDRLMLIHDDANRTFKLKPRKLHFIAAFIVCIVAVIFGCSQFFIDPECTGLNTATSKNVEHRRTWLTSTEGCLPETSHTIQYGRISLFEYIAYHDSFVGRIWLIDLIEKELFANNADNRGVILEAGMGYGKSAFIKYIICASDGSPAGKLRRRLVAYHVCRYDVLISKQAYVFVLRLINMISSQMPFLADKIKSCTDVFNGNMCEKDPNGCLDQCLIIPLKYISYSGEPVIIAIDGLDECFDKYRDINDILNILKQRLYRFPSWIKFLISTRPDSRIRHLTKDLFRLEVSDDSDDNINDINIYLETLAMNRTAEIDNRFTDFNVTNFLLLSLQRKDEGIEAVDTSFPTSLDRYYEEQFSRLFETKINKAFEDAKIILEVMSSTFQKTTKDNIWKVLSNTTSMTLKQFDKSLQMLDNFIRKIGDELHLIHMSLQQWLLSPANIDFSVDIENGHEKNAMYIFKQIEFDFYESDIVDLAIHVSISTSNAIEQQFLNLSDEEMAKFEHGADEYPLIRLAKRVDSTKTTNILTSHFQNVDKRNKDNQTALFIAASLGHVKTFDALIKKGADIHFRTSSYYNIINFEKALQVAIEHQLWDYGVLDIAAQNGHTNIVEYVLENNVFFFDYPFKKNNSMMLLPIHLACKKGHLKVVQQLHSRYKWMLDWQCLYYACEIGKVSLVKYILEKNIKDECRRCEAYMHWIPKGHLRVQGQLLYFDSHNYTYVLYDDWKDITCESALHVAVRENKLDVIKLLLSQSKHATACLDRGGRTPSISALQYGFKGTIEFFISTGLLKGNEKCAAVRLLNDSLKLHENELYRLNKYCCESDMSVVHIVAKYDHLWVSDMMTRYGGKLDWNRRDGLGCYPIHKAACHSSMTTLGFLLEQSHTQFDYYKCLNGSTPLHSAVACGSVSATSVLLSKYRGYDRESKDVKMSYIKHALWTDYGIELAREVEDTEMNISRIIDMLFTEVSDLETANDMNRNILHYAIQKGHFYVVLNLFSRFSEKSKKLLLIKDDTGRNPLYYAIHLLGSFSHFVISPNVFGRNDLLNEPLDRMTAKEYALLLTLNFMKHSKILHIDQSLLKLLIRRQCLHIISFLLESSDFFLFKDKSTLSNIIEADRYGLLMLTYYAIAAKQITSELHPKSELDILRSKFICKTCTEVITKCITHKISHSYLKISNIISLLQLNLFHNSTVTHFFPKHQTLLMSSCYDSGQYNVLERAIQGGSPDLVRYLMDIDVRSNLEKDQLIKMAMNGLRYRPEDKYVPYITISNAGFVRISFMTHEKVLEEFSAGSGYSTKTTLLMMNIDISINELYHGTVSHRRINSDKLVSELITSYKNDIVKRKICLPSSRKFSIIHRLAFEGLKSSLELAVKYWGKDILKCQTTDGFTPLYMSKIFQYGETTKFIEGHGVIFQAPLKTAEMYFLFKLQFKYSFSRNEKKHIQCIMSYTKIIPNSTYRKIKAYNCARKVMHTTKSKTFLVTLYKWTLSVLIEMNTWNKIILHLLKITNMETVSYADRYYLKKKALTLLTFYRNYFKTIEKKYVVTDNHNAKLIQILDTESRVCKYLRTSYKKMLLTLLALQDEEENSKLGGRIKEPDLNNIKLLLADLAQYNWDSENCTEIDEIDSEGRAVITISRLVRRTFHMLRLELIGHAINESVFLPFSAERANFSDILLNHDLWLRLYHRYNYMNELQTSPILKESYLYKSKSVNIFKQYMKGIRTTLQFVEWNSNSAKLLQDYLTKKKKEDTFPT